MGKGNFYAKCDKPTSIHSFRKPSWDMNIFSTLSTAVGNRGILKTGLLDVYFLGICEKVRTLYKSESIRKVFWGLQQLI